ncbi:hypothetical protein [Sorangium sp. So ce381]|uniref:hypothetical protein n=1 Tax=Sorangium sp. So ce381 TaxID=3133307 RepID=UPI003F5B7B3B
MCVIDVEAQSGHLRALALEHLLQGRAESARRAVSTWLESRPRLNVTQAKRTEIKRSAHADRAAPNIGESAITASTCTRYSGARW